MSGGTRTITLVPPFSEGDKTTLGTLSLTEYSSFKSRPSTRGMSANRTTTDAAFSRVAKRVDWRTPALSPCPSWGRNDPSGKFASALTFRSGETTRTLLNSSDSSTEVSTSFSMARMSFFLSRDPRDRESLLLLSSNPLTGMTAKSLVISSPPASKNPPPTWPLLPTSPLLSGLKQPSFQDR